MVRCWGERPGASKGDMTMPRNKDLKRLVRARMKKTGEAYTTARAQLLKRPRFKTRSAVSAASVSSAPKQNFAEAAGMSDASIKAKTGCNWERWVKTLDKFGADKKSHREVASMIAKTWKLDGWWAQTVTVGYERIKGLRARGQRRDGSYEATKSRTFSVPLDKLFDAFNDSKRRARWLSDVELDIRHATPNKSMRLRWPAGSAVDVGFFSKGTTKSQVAIGHRKLASQSDAMRMKTFWSDKLRALAEQLGAG